MIADIHEMSPQLSIPLFKVFMAQSAHDALKSVIESGHLAAADRVAEFENRLAAWLGAPDAVAISDASGALTLALLMAGVRPGDEVIASPLACSASLMPVANLFAKPVWCDIDPFTGMPSAADIAARISPATRAILLYHWSGDVAEVGEIMALARKHGIKLIADASEALGAEWHGCRMWRETDFTVYSFYATKPVTTGEGGLLLAPEKKVTDAARRLRRYGIDQKRIRLANGDLNPAFDIPLAGFNFAMNEIAATLGIENLGHADRLLARQRANGDYYQVALDGVAGLHLLERRNDRKSVYWTYTLRAERRHDLIRKLHACGIGAQRLHLRNDAYSCFGGVAAELPGVALFDEQNLCIPCGWWVGDVEREQIADCIREGW